MTQLIAVGLVGGTVLILWTGSPPDRRTVLAALGLLAAAAALAMAFVSDLALTAIGHGPGGSRRTQLGVHTLGAVLQVGGFGLIATALLIRPKERS